MLFVDSSNFAHFERYDTSGNASSGTFGFRIHWDSTNSKNVLYVEGGGNTDYPYTVQASASTPTTHVLTDTIHVEDGDKIWFYGAGTFVGSNPLFVFTINNTLLWSSGATVTPATYDVPNDTGGRQSASHIFRIYDLNLIKFNVSGHGYRVSFQHEDAPSTFQILVCYTNTNNDPVEDHYSVTITTSNSNKTVYLTKSLSYLPTLLI